MRQLGALAESLNDYLKVACFQRLKRLTGGAGKCRKVRPVKEGAISEDVVATGAAESVAEKSVHLLGMRGGSLSDRVMEGCEQRILWFG